MRTRICVAIVSAIAAATSAWPVRADEPAIIEVPVAFTVQNVNRSAVPCPADGRPYTVRGSLVLPAGAVPESVTLYVHGSGNARSWHFTAVPGYDYATEMARLGHASVVIDQLGYGDSDIPDGRQLCLGSLADIASQIAGQLRAADYRVATGEAVAFSRVGLGGHSMGGAVAHVASYSFPASFDAIVLAGWVDAIVPQTALAGIRAQRTALVGVGRQIALRCLASEPKRPGAPAGYAYVFERDELRHGGLFANGDPAVSAAFAESYERDSCATFQSLGQVVAVNLVRTPSVTTPVLILLGEHDLFPPSAGQLLRAKFSGSDDVSLQVVADTGHSLWLERTAPAVRAVLHHWLSERGF